MARVRWIAFTKVKAGGEGDAARKVKAVDLLIKEVKNKEEEVKITPGFGAGGVTRLRRQRGVVEKLMCNVTDMRVAVYSQEV